MKGLMALCALLMVLAVPATASAGSVRWFHSPSGNIQCEVSYKTSRGTYAYCQTFQPAASVTLKASGSSKLCSGGGCLGDGPPQAFTLGYGKAVKIGIFRCTSRTSGMTCRVIGKGHGFTIARSGIRRF
ncbi:MAG: hypothetical protein JWM71_1018 [Solirubrobacteraceae bacterium]|nr:hypothetical protein [Solirubrobacteraceae bacterium]